jgi:hypothetical protein
VATVCCCGRDALSSRPAASSHHPYRQRSQRGLVPRGLIISGFVGGLNVTQVLGAVAENGDAPGAHLGGRGRYGGSS